MVRVLVGVKRVINYAVKVSMENWNLIAKRKARSKNLPKKMDTIRRHNVNDLIMCVRSDNMHHSR